MHWHSVNLPRGQAPRLPVSLTELTNLLSPREPFQSAPVPTGRSKIEDFRDHERLHLSDDVDSERHSPIYVGRCMVPDLPCYWTLSQTH